MKEVVSMQAGSRVGDATGSFMSNVRAELEILFQVCKQLRRV